MSEDQKPWTWQERMNLGLFLMEFPALTVMVFLRRRIGLRLLPVWRVFLLGFALLWLFNPFDPVNFTGPYVVGWLGVFGVAFLFLGSYQRGQRWRDFKRGVKWHSYHRGISLLSWLPFTPEYNIRRFVEPIVVMVAGYFALRYLSPALGSWLFLSAISLRFVEDHYHKQNLERHLDMQDSVVSSEIVDETVQHFEKPKALTGNQEAGPVETGLSDDLKDLMKRRKGRK